MFILTDKRRCIKCGEWKDKSEFHKDRSKKSNKDGLKPRCKTCVLLALHEKRSIRGDEMRERERNWYASNLEKLREKMRVRYAADLEKNRERVRENARKMYARDPQRIIKNTVQSGRNRRAWKIGNGGRITNKQWQALKEFYSFTCLCCRRREPEVKLELDHVIPLSLGGPHDIGNTQPLCKSCNSSKRDKHIDYRGNYDR